MSLRSYSDTESLTSKEIIVNKFSPENKEQRKSEFK